MAASVVFMSLILFGIVLTQVCGDLLGKVLAFTLARRRTPTTPSTLSEQVSNADMFLLLTDSAHRSVTGHG
jgi:hypothetical protein